MPRTAKPRPSSAISTTSALVRRERSSADTILPVEIARLAVAGDIDIIVVIDVDDE